MYETELKDHCPALGSGNLSSCNSVSNIAYHPYNFDVRARSVYKNSCLIPLTSIEFRLALYFFACQGGVTSRDRLLENVWNTSTEIKTRTIDVHISSLRKKLGLHSTVWRIESVYGKGYRLKRTGT